MSNGWVKAVGLESAMKKNGFKIESPNGVNSYWVEANGRIASWHNQAGNVGAIHCRRKEDIPDSMTDYFPGYFVHTIKGAINYLQKG